MSTLGPRLTITFTDPQLAWLRAEAKRLGISVGELHRRIVDTVRLPMLVREVDKELQR